MIVAILDDDTYIDPEEVAGINPWVEYATGITDSNKTIGSIIYLKSSYKFHIKGKSPNEVFEFIRKPKRQDARSVAADALYKYVQEYINKHEITCGDTVQQMDKLVIDAPNFMEKCCELAGYYVIDG
jgi:hypothetical protein